MNQSFEYINTYSKAIYNILERMKNFKQIKYSNGNKTLHDIIYTVLSTMEIHQKGLFTYSLDNQLKDYKLAENSLRNEDMLNLFTNHVKNSLEANSTKINININHHLKSNIYIHIVDNGNGISEKAIKKVYNPNFSTKAGNGDIRGVGMYLSKSLLQTVGGDEHIVESSIHGTVIELFFPVKSSKSLD
ncbi:histidine kinase [Thiovulum sp. ES]|nr:histidine kinase [Thiovulum sp. ES]